MWKFLLLGVLLLALVPTVVSADTTADITITAYGYVGVGAPSNLVLTYISDYEIGITWTKGPDAINTMIRVEWGSTPEDRNDGYLVYYGNATSTIHWTSVATALDITHYRAWSQSVNGTWEEIGISTEASFMSLTILFIAVLILGIALFIAAFRWKDMLLSYAAALTWMAIGFWWIIGDLTNFGLSQSWSQILVFVPFILAFSVLLRLMNTEITSEAKGRKWTEWGPAPREEVSNRRVEYRDMLRKRLGGR